MINIIAAYRKREKRDIEPRPPAMMLFCVNQLPALINAVYQWQDTEVWDDDLFWIDR
jgi:hypothetical protein